MEMLVVCGLGILAICYAIYNWIQFKEFLKQQKKWDNARLRVMEQAKLREYSVNIDEAIKSISDDSDITFQGELSDGAKE